MIGRAMAALGAELRRRIELLPPAEDDFRAGAAPKSRTQKTYYRPDGPRPRRPLFTRYTLVQRPGWGLHVHRFHDPDPDPMHSHPWVWAVSMIVAGCYRETRRVHGTYDRLYRVLRPGQINVLTAETLHRVEPLGGECWTVIVTGPKGGSWGFLETDVTPWRPFLDRLWASARVEPKDDEEGRLCGVSPHVA